MQCHHQSQLLGLAKDLKVTLRRILALHKEVMHVNIRVCVCVWVDWKHAMLSDLFERATILFM